MTRIRIEDLPPLEQLSPEELLRILGAGRFKQARLGLEGLEMRMMPATVTLPTITPIKGQTADMVITGTDGVDKISVTSGVGTLTVNDQVTGISTTYKTNATRIVFYGLGSDDVFSNHTALRTLARGGDGNDTLTGSNTASDELYGDHGNDTVKGRGGNDKLYASTGEGAEDKVVATTEQYSNFLQGNLGNDMLYGGSARDAMGGHDGDDSLFGHGGNDLLRGEGDGVVTPGNDLLRGGTGSDEMWGGGGNDKLEGGAGADTMYGEAGNDDLYAHAEFPDSPTDGKDDIDNLFGGTGADELYARDGGYDNLDAGVDSDLDTLISDIQFDWEETLKKNPFAVPKPGDGIFNAASSEIHIDKP